MNAIGGYFGLELDQKNEYHSEAIRLNTGRNALEYILITRSYKKIYLPYYTCEVLLEPVRKLGLLHELYHIDENFEPIFNFSLIKENECFLYTNYFGLKESFLLNLVEICPNLIVDNAQAFYSKPLKNIDTFYSVRKFFGVPDGAYLFTNKILEAHIDKDISYQRCEHLLRRLDVSAEEGHNSFIKNESFLSNQPILQMSQLTKSILQSIDYSTVASKRIYNFKYLDQYLKDCNLITFSLKEGEVPMIYPFLSMNLNPRKKLLDHKIYCPQYWTNVLQWTNKNSIEYKFANDITYLPIDQRYCEVDLNYIVTLIR